MIELELPFPPSGNHRNKLGRNRANGKTIIYRTEKTARYYNDVKIIWLMSKQKMVDYACEAHIHYFMPDLRKRDEDNLRKTLFDALQYAGVVADDNLIWPAFADKDEKIVKGGAVLIKIRPTVKRPKFWALTYINPSDT